MEYIVTRLNKNKSSEVRRLEDTQEWKSITERTDNWMEGNEKKGEKKERDLRT